MRLQNYNLRLKESTILAAIQGESYKDKNIYFTREECEEMVKRTSSKFNVDLNIFLLGSGETLSNSSQDYITALAVELFKMFAEEKITKKGDAVFILKNSTGGFRILGRDLNEITSRVFVQHLDEKDPFERKATITLSNNQGFELSFILLTRMVPKAEFLKEKKDEDSEKVKDELTLLKDHILFHNSKMENKKEVRKSTPKEVLKEVLSLKENENLFVTSDNKSFEDLDGVKKNVILTDDETLMVIWDIIRMHSTVENLSTREMTNGYESIITPTTTLSCKTLGVTRLKQKDNDVICTGLIRKTTEVVVFSVTQPEYVKRLQYILDILLK